MTIQVPDSRTLPQPGAGQPYAGPPWGEPDPWTSPLWGRPDTVAGYGPGDRPPPPEPPVGPAPGQPPRGPRPGRRLAALAALVALALVLTAAVVGVALRAADRTTESITEEPERGRRTGQHHDHVFGESEEAVVTSTASRRYFSTSLSTSTSARF